VLYFSAYQNVKRRNYQAAQNASLAVGIASALFALIDFVIQDIVAAVLALLVAAVLFYAWQLLRTEGA